MLRVLHMSIRRIYNNTSYQSETLHREQCPRCRGFGACSGDRDGCSVCDGKGEVWRGESGVTVPLGARDDQQRYY